MQVTLLINANPDELPALLDYLAQHSSIIVQWGMDVLPPLLGLEQLPPDAQLTETERALVQHDLRGDRRSSIAHALDLSPGTITVYRRTIRRKFRRMQRTQWLPWMESWIRRFPGHIRREQT